MQRKIVRRLEAKHVFVLPPAAAHFCFKNALACVSGSRNLNERAARGSSRMPAPISILRPYLESSLKRLQASLLNQCEASQDECQNMHLRSDCRAATVSTPPSLRPLSVHRHSFQFAARTLSYHGRLRPENGGNRCSASCSFTAETRLFSLKREIFGRGSPDYTIENCKYAFMESFILVRATKIWCARAHSADSGAVSAVAKQARKKQDWGQIQRVAHCNSEHPQS